MKAAIYARVSTVKKTKKPIDGSADAKAAEDAPKDDARSFEQRPEIQIEALQSLSAHRASGAREKRPGLHSLMTDARRGQFDIVIVWRFDRFARSVKQLVLALEEFRALNIDFVSHQESLDTSTPMGKAMFTIIAAMAELERSVIRERVVCWAELHPGTWHEERQARRTPAPRLSPGRSPQGTQERR